MLSDEDTKLSNLWLFPQVIVQLNEKKRVMLSQSDGNHNILNSQLKYLLKCCQNLEHQRIQMQ